jgi:CelD/BcsL family acetyltransferase involved in cellulose biosynthesis
MYQAMLDEDLIVQIQCREGKARGTMDRAATKIDVTDNIAGLEADWLDFQGRGIATFYQTYQWCSAWQDCVGRARNIEPRIVTGRNEDGKLIFLLPMAIRRHRGLALLEWLAMAQSSYGYGIYDPNFLAGAAQWFADSGWSIIQKLGEIDAINLRELPAKLYGYIHPLQSWFSIRGRNFSYAMKLGAPFEDVYASKRSAESRRGNRKRDAKLAGVGNIGFGLPENRDHAHLLIDAMFAQQRDRLAESGIHGVFGRLEREFIHRLLDLPENMQPALLPYHLTVGGKMEAMMLGGNYGGIYWALISSLGAGETRRYSPGDAALRRTIEACCARGFSAFDFSSGDTAYKLSWADDIIPLHDVVRGVSLKGYAWAAATLPGIAAKRTIKQTPVLWRMATALRKSNAQA